MKNKLKYLITALVLALAITLAPITAGAEEITAPEGEEYTEVTEAEEVNFFSKVFTEISEYTSEILCALTLAGSLTLAVAYKKGLFPLIEKSLLAIGGAITKIKDSTKESEERNSALTQKIEDKLEGAEKVLESLASRVDSLDTALTESLRSEGDKEREKTEMRIILSAQIDMLYDIFMTSTLPQYKKDEVGERIAAMREAMAGNEAE